MTKVFKLTVPFKQREIGGGTSGSSTFFLNERPQYLPEQGQNVLITHTNVDDNSGLKRKLENKSTNTVSATFQSYSQDTENTDINNGFEHFFTLTYHDVDFGNNKGGGDCFGYIEYEVNPDNFNVLKSIENSTIVTEVIPYDNDTGKNSLSGDTNTNNFMYFFTVDRTNNNSEFVNLFQSFGLPTTNTQKEKYEQSPLGELTVNSGGDIIINGVNFTWSSGGAQDTLHPYTGFTGDFYNTAYSGFNTDEILVFNIPHNEYGELIDGRTIELDIPTGTTSNDRLSVYSAFKKNSEFLGENKFTQVLSEPDYSASQFGTDTDLSEELNDYESNIAFLFSDAIKSPTNSSFNSWSEGIQDAQNGVEVYDKNKLQKPFFDFYKDQSVGIAYLDKGFIVITDPTIVSDYKALLNGQSSNIITTGITGNQQIFSGQTFTPPIISYTSYNTEKSLNIVCLASTDEFFRTVNDTAKSLVGKEDEHLADFKNDFASDSLKPIKITEVGIHDNDGNLLAVAKPPQPIEKYWYEVSAFQIKIRL